MFSLSWVLLILVSLIQFIIDLPGPVNEGVNHFASLLLYVPMFTSTSVDMEGQDVLEFQRTIFLLALEQKKKKTSF